MPQINKQPGSASFRALLQLLFAKLLAHCKMKRGAAPDSPPARAREYAGSGVPAAVKEHTAHFVVALQGQGVPVETILKALADTYYAPKRRTLMEHMAAIKGDNAPLSTEKVVDDRRHSRTSSGDCFWMGFAPTKNCTSRDRAKMDCGKLGRGCVTCVRVQT